MLTLNFPFFAEAQLEGKYCTPADFTGKCLTFEKNNHFEFFEWSCIYQKNGIGTYGLKGKKITLNFENTEIPFDNKINSSECNDSLININIKVFDSFEVDPAVGAVIFVENSNHEIITGAYADIEGAANIQLQKSNEKHFLYVTYLGTESDTITLTTNKNYDVKINIETNFYQKMEGKLIYKIKKITENSIFLKELHSKSKTKKFIKETK